MNNDFLMFLFEFECISMRIGTSGAQFENNKIKSGSKIPLGHQDLLSLIPAFGQPSIQGLDHHGLNLITGRLILINETILILHLFAADVLLIHKHMIFLIVPELLCIRQDGVLLDTFHQLDCELLVRVKFALDHVGLLFLNVDTRTHEVQFELDGQDLVVLRMILVLRVLLQTGQHAHRLTDDVTQQAALDLCDLEGSGNENN